MAKQGRPTKFKTEYCERIESLGRQGMSVTEMASALDVTAATLRNWARTHTDFYHAFARARTYSQAWWERLARWGITQPANALNPSLYAKAMSARFPEDYRNIR